MVNDATMSVRTLRYALQVAGPGLALFLLAGKLFWWDVPWLGWVGFLLYLYFVGAWWQELWRRVFGVKQQEWCTYLLAYGSLIVLLSLISGVFVAWYKLSAYGVWGVYMLVAAVTYGYLQFLRKKRGWQKARVKLGSGSSLVLFRKHWGLVGAFCILLVTALYYLLQGSGASAALSPWQVLHPYYAPIIFLLTIVVGVLVFSRYSVKLLLGVVVLYTALLHLYLPLTHSLPWGGDAWRHIGIEKQIVAGEYIYPVLLGDKIETKEIGPVVVPAVLLHPQKYSYSQFWGLHALLSQTLSSDLLSVHIWVVPLLWSLLLPLLLFRLGASILGSWRYGLLLALLVNIAFPFQVLGALSLPVSLGYLTFFFALTLWMHFLRTRHPYQRNVALAVGLLLFFGYPLHALVFWFMVGCSYLVQLLLHQRWWFRRTQHHALARKVASMLLVIAAIVFIPVVELVGNVSSFSSSLQIADSFRQAIGQLSGWFYASAIRPHDIASGNLLFNHTPLNAYVKNMFTIWRWVFMPAMMALFGLALFGLWKVFREKRTLIRAVCSLLLVSTLSGYLVGWFLLSGDRLLARRMDALVVFVLLLYALIGIRSLPTMRVRYQRLAVFGGILLCSWLATATYASGPDMRSVTRDEFLAASYVWQEEDHDATAHCVIADTWALLALEGVSARAIEGGGFPIDYQFGQPDRVRLYGEMIVSPTSSLLHEAHNLTGATSCWIVLPTDHLGETVREDIQEITHSPLQEVGSLMLWREATPEPLSDEGNEE